MIFVIVFAFSRSRRTGYRSLDQEARKTWKVPSPFGVALAVTAILFLGLKTWDSLA